MNLPMSSPNEAIAGPRVVMLGPPGSGKGTHASLLAERFNIPHLSTGAMLRREMAAASPLGVRVAVTVDAGQLVDDAAIIELVRAAITSRCPSRWILDGAPRIRRPGAAAYARVRSRWRGASHHDCVGRSGGGGATTAGRARQTRRPGRRRTRDHLAALRGVGSDGFSAARVVRAGCSVWWMAWDLWETWRRGCSRQLNVGVFEGGQCPIRLSR